MKLLLKIFRILLVIVAVIISLLLLLAFATLIALIVKYIGNDELREVYSRDLSLIPQIQAQIIPFSFKLAIGYVVWAGILFAIRMKRMMWLFCVLAILTGVVGAFGFPVVNAILTKPVTKEDKIEKYEEAEERARIGKESLENIDELSFKELGAALEAVDNPPAKSHIPLWVVYAKRVINEWPKEEQILMKEFSLEKATKMISRHYGSLEALDAIREIEDELMNSTAEKSIIMFTYVNMAKAEIANPPYLVIEGDIEQKRKIFSETLQKAESEKDIIYEAPRSAEKAKKLAKEGNYNAAFKLYKQALDSKFIFSDKEKIDVGRGFVDVLLEVNNANNLEDWENAIAIQKLILKKGKGVQFLNVEILKLWKLYEGYQALVKKTNQPVKSSLIEKELEMDAAREKQELERRFDHFGDKSHIFWDLGGYYYRHLDFESAESTLLEGVKYVQALKAAGTEINRSRHMSEDMFRDLLKNLYLILGRYEDAIEQIKEMKTLLMNAPMDRYYSKRNTVTSSARFDHYILALERARQKKLKPMDLQYSDDFNYSFITFEDPDWIEWAEKNKEIQKQFEKE